MKNRWEELKKTHKDDDLEAEAEKYEKENTKRAIIDEEDSNIKRETLEKVFDKKKEDIKKSLEEFEEELKKTKKEKEEIENYLQGNYDWKPGENRSIAFLSEDYRREYIELTEELKNLDKKVYDLESKIKFEKENHEN